MIIIFAVNQINVAYIMYVCYVSSLPELSWSKLDLFVANFTYSVSEFPLETDQFSMDVSCAGMSVKTSFIRIFPVSSRTACYVQIRASLQLVQIWGFVGYLMSPKAPGKKKQQSAVIETRCLVKTFLGHFCSGGCVPRFLRRCYFFPPVTFPFMFVNHIILKRKFGLSVSANLNTPLTYFYNKGLLLLRISVATVWIKTTAKLFKFSLKIMRNCELTKEM